MPFIVYAIFGDRTYVLYNFIPFVDEQQFSGYMVLLVYHYVTAAVAYAGTVGADLLIVFIIANIWPITRLFRVAVDEINVLLLDENKNKRRSKLSSKKLKKILRMHLDMYK